LNTQKSDISEFQLSWTQHTSYYLCTVHAIRNLQTR
jgi:hypothetical protein